ncbi:MAG: hypothetical protein M1819_006076 [Sarea resinae]|nr:MAG: hypothetical protein M1819_006076 [Sarea resinae]
MSDRGSSSGRSRYSPPSVESTTDFSGDELNKDGVALSPKQTPRRLHRAHRSINPSAPPGSEKPRREPRRERSAEPSHSAASKAGSKSRRRISSCGPDDLERGLKKQYPRLGRSVEPPGQDVPRPRRASMGSLAPVRIPSDGSHKSENAKANGKPSKVLAANSSLHKLKRSPPSLESSLSGNTSSSSNSTLTQDSYLESSKRGVSPEVRPNAEESNSSPSNYYERSDAGKEALDVFAYMEEGSTKPENVAVPDSDSTSLVRIPRARESRKVSFAGVENNPSFGSLNSDSDISMQGTSPEQTSHDEHPGLQDTTNENPNPTTGYEPAVQRYYQRPDARDPRYYYAGIPAPYAPQWSNTSRPDPNYAIHPSQRMQPWMPPPREMHHPRPMPPPYQQVYRPYVGYPPQLERPEYYYDPRAPRAVPQSSGPDERQYQQPEIVPDTELPTPSPAASLASPARPASPDSEVPEKPAQTISGYELLASKLSFFCKRSPPDGDPSLVPLYRKFESLNHRVLLHLQDEISELESDLRNIDELDARMRKTSEANEQEAKTTPASRRVDGRLLAELQSKRLDVLGRIFLKVGQYNQALTSFSNLVNSLPLPRKVDISAYQSWLTTNAPITEQECRFLRHEADLLSLTPRDEHQGASSATAQLALAISISSAAILVPLVAFSTAQGVFGRLLIILTIAGSAALSVLLSGRASQTSWIGWIIATYVGVLGIAACVAG